MLLCPLLVFVILLKQPDSLVVCLLILFHSKFINYHFPYVSCFSLAVNSVNWTKSDVV